ncbi:MULTISPECIES: oligopeptide/dipeptide ABC transporter ATP-binding protein [Devosia]|uniref:Oligopeptide transport ATP-binding protein OppF n=1 Tax=Devosia equisanguinis TaxID=2490941 RepID=A0A3S4EP44_9HYPH|nr:MULTISPECIES: oligopeptide/dipeptide ABC transporter ATP-binding protein [Devosia]ODT50161.1 MAG: peptide ABC transporter ATP-binding protein [Pelagibacterium sp. SCN 63-126]ODU87375.1 MAG: peptide ABC transporter ATP-binding protein [Pelagibacterium sp. SCN 63-17]OJX44903.1 MAG: peptide ABC transporter ATP-binding protein [Devosia sp. 63-57]VDS06616.1 Oligopeptide transport ATP-binding protein OppF [Devosia equisanguinis]
MSELPVLDHSSLPDDVLFSVRNLKKYFPIQAGWLKKHVGDVKAIDDVSLDIRKGETLGLVGESGSGKSTVARLMLRAYELTDGQILFRRANNEIVDLSKLSDREMRPLRAEMQMIFQDPYSSLNPRMTLLELVGEPMVIHGVGSPGEIKDRVAELLKVVGLRPEFINRYPHAFSGGQRQRIGIARALALNPSFIAADEAVSALDVSVAAQNINLLQDLQEQFGLTYLFITHDLGMVEHISDRVGVMYLGRLMEVAPTRSLFSRPLHPYTEALMAAVPQPDPRGNRTRKRVPLKGEIANAANPPSGCNFHPRCPYAQPKCSAEVPALRDVEGGRQVRCHFAEELSLVGAVA